MTAVLLDPVPCLRGLDPAEVDQSDPRGTVYLQHLDTGLVFPRGGSIRPATPDDDPRRVLVLQHYFGWSSQGHLEQRMIEHRTGSNGSRFLRIARRQGVTWHLARTWPGDRREERRIKNMGGARRSCPSCGILTRAERQLLRRPDGRYASTRETPVITVSGSTARRAGQIVARLSWGEAGLLLVTVRAEPGGEVIGRLVRTGDEYLAMTAEHPAAPTPSDRVLASGVSLEAAIAAVLDR